MTGGAPPRRKPARPPRDQEPSSFSAILERLVASTPGGRGAALVDSEGETVDYAGRLDPFEMKVAAATWLIVLTEADATRLVKPTQIVVRAKRNSYVVRRVHSDYAIVLVLHARAAFSVSERALAEAETGLATEAGWGRKGRHAWFSVSVQTGAERRPVELFVADRWQPIEVMGMLVGLHDRERGYRVRLPSGVEMMLVRERSGLWFCDEPVVALEHAAAAARAGSRA
jgi:predicted regulator of Ras-like GTPase activity (Roadblock/LC7/MglB family)